MGAFLVRMVRVLAAVLVPLSVMLACDVPAPNPLAAGAIGTTAQGGNGVSTASGGSSGSTFTGGAVQSPPDASVSSMLVSDRADRSWPTTSCPGGPCAAPNVCVNLDFLFVACVPCGGDDDVCCPGSACDPGLVCAANPNFQRSPPMDLVERVCQRPGHPPPADGHLNHQGERVKRSVGGGS